MMQQGLIIVMTGDGKGKTTAALGVTLRAAGQGLKVLFIQFMKGQSEIGELRALSMCNLPITVKQFGRPGFVQSRACEPLDIHLAYQGLDAWSRAMENEGYDLIVLDEINVAVNFGLLKMEDVMDILHKNPPELHLILTGRNATSPLLELADLVTEMINVKHPFNGGGKAQKGIEY